MSRRFEYVRLADEVEEQIGAGEFRAGEKLPSIRKLQGATGLSMTTVHQAYIELEKRGVVESREKSGFYVKPRTVDIPVPEAKTWSARPRTVRADVMARELVERMGDPRYVSLGCAAPDARMLPLPRLARMARSFSLGKYEEMFANYEPPTGNAALRREIAKRFVGVAGPCTAEDVIVTNGAQEALELALRAVVRPGGVVAVESPCYPLLVHLLEDLGLFAIEIPTDPVHGMLVDHLEHALARFAISAVVVVPNFQNPTGALMPREEKARLAKLADRKNVPVIEDDVYGELYFGETRPGLVRAHSERGLVITCSSVSKTLASGARVGWIMPGAFYNQVARLKCHSNICTAGLMQHVVAEFLREGAYDRHLRKLRGALRTQMSQLAAAVGEHFPPGVRMTSPEGGMLLWVEPDAAVDSFRVYHRAEEAGIAVLPGAMCAVSDRYSHCLRLNSGREVGGAVTAAIQTLGRILAEEVRNPVETGEPAKEPVGA